MMSVRDKWDCGDEMFDLVKPTEYYTAEDQFKKAIDRLKRFDPDFPGGDD